MAVNPAQRLARSVDAHAPAYASRPYGAFVFAVAMSALVCAAGAQTASRPVDTNDQIDARLNEGRCADAEQLASAALAAAAQQPDRKSEAQLRLLLARALLDGEKVADAEPLLRKLRESCLAAGASVASRPASQAATPDSQPATRPATELSAFCVQVELAWADFLLATGKPLDARAALDALGEQPFRKRRDELSAMYQLASGRVMLACGQTIEAETALTVAVERFDELRGKRDWRAGWARLALGEAQLRIMGKFADADETLRVAAETLIESRAAFDPLTVRALERVVAMLERKKKYDVAESLLRRALVCAERETGERAIEVVNHARLRLARNLIRQKQYEPAEPLIRRAADALSDGKTAPAGGRSELAAEAWSDLADLYRRTKRFADATMLNDRALALRESLAKGDAQHLGVALSRAQRGRIMLDEQDAPGAEIELAIAAPIIRARLGESDWRSGAVRLALGDARFRLARYEEAEEDVVYGTRILLAARGPDDDSVEGLRLCANLYQASGNPEQANFYSNMLPEAHRHDDHE